MSNNAPGVSYSQAQSIAEQAAARVRAELLGEIRSLRNELHTEINSLRNELHREIQRLENEMREIGQMIVSELKDQTAQISHRIETQTAAVVGGVAANTLMLESAKAQIENQTEANLQIEVGKKMSESMASHGKLMAFASDIKNRFMKSLEAFYINRMLYNVNFNKIIDEYSNKLSTIGEHIFAIKEKDVLPAIDAAQSALEEIHSLPMEVDLYRLQVRSENLDKTLQILKSSRFDKILNSIKNLDELVSERYALPNNKSADVAEFSIVALVTKSVIATNVLVGSSVKSIDEIQSLNIALDHDLAEYDSEMSKLQIENTISKSNSVEPNFDEISKMLSAAKSLYEKEIISKESLLLVEDFLGSGNLKLVK